MKGRDCRDLFVGHSKIELLRQYFHRISVTFKIKFTVFRTQQKSMYDLPEDWASNLKHQRP